MLTGNARGDARSNAHSNAQGRAKGNAENNAPMLKTMLAKGNATGSTEGFLTNSCSHIRAIVPAEEQAVDGRSMQMCTEFGKTTQYQRRCCNFSNIEGNA